MIDILAILLIFFIVTTTFKQSDSLVKVNLPRSSEMKGVDDAEKRTPLALGEDGQVSLGSLVAATQAGLEIGELPLRILLRE